jgi:ATP/ADP translocase
MTPATPTVRRSVLQKLLRAIADVHDGETTGVLMLALNLFLVLGAYYMLKTVRESLILTEGGAASFTVPMFAVINLVIALGWIGIVAALNPAYRAPIGAPRSVDNDAHSAAPNGLLRPKEAVL